MRLRRALLTCCLLAIALGAGSCGGDDREGSVEQSGGSTTGETATTGTTATRTTPAPSGAASATVKVRETEYKIDPENPRLAKAGVVDFEVRNTGKVPHALEIEGPGGEVKTDTIAPGRRVTLKADLSRPGTYKWYCPVGDHEDRGMTGKVSVAGGGARSGSDDAGGDDGGAKSGSGPGSGGGAGKRPGAGGAGGGGVY